MRLLIEGWRQVLHSFAVVNHYYLLELTRRPELGLTHIDRPYLGVRWRPMSGLFRPEEEQRIMAVGPPGSERADVCLRLLYPYDFTPPAARRLVVFAAADVGAIPDNAVVGNRSIGTAQRESGAVMATLSQWSREGLLLSGVDPDRVFVSPLGADTSRFRPLAPEARDALRRSLGWEGKFVFLNVGAMTLNKGVGLAARALAAITDRHPDAILFLKGADHTYKSKQILDETFAGLPPEARAQAGSRILYNGGPLSFDDMAKLYQAADAYVSPYSAEGFNLPVLEAMACGLPVICSRGGSTDDFVNPEASLPIEARVVASGTARYLDVSFDDLVVKMERAIEDSEWRRRARAAGPPWVVARHTWKAATDRLLEICALGS